MTQVNAGWTVVDERLPLLTYSYTFAPEAVANALAIGGPEGLIVLSPPARPKEEAFTELERHGKVRALVASNAFHHLGLPAWKKRYPDATIFAPAQGVARVEKRTKLSGVRPIAEAASLLAPNVELVDMPHYRTGEILARIKTETDLIWFITDLIFNLPALPKAFPIHQIFKWTNSGPGFKLNGVGTVFMVRDRPALYRWMRREVEKAPPTLVLPCHGPPVRMDPPGQLLLDLLPAG